MDTREVFNFVLERLCVNRESIYCVNGVVLKRLSGTLFCCYQSDLIQELDNRFKVCYRDYLPAY